MRRDSAVQPGEVALIGLVRRQMHWMADDILRALLGAGSQAPKP